MELRPLSVVVGANSSGKSTLLQAILAVAQAVRAESDAAQFPLNGEFVRLGTLDETRNFLARDSSVPMMIKVGLVDRQSRVRRPSTPAPEAESVVNRLIGVDWTLYLSHDANEESGFARVSSLEIVVSRLFDTSDNQKAERQISLDISEIGTTSSSLPLSRALRRPGLTAAFRTAGFELAPVAASGRLMDWESSVPARIEAVTLVGGIPVEVMSRRTRLDALSEAWWDAATNLLDEMIREARLEYAEKQQAAPLNGENAKRRVRSRAAINQAYSDISRFRPEELDADEEIIDLQRGIPSDPQFFFFQQLAPLPDGRKRSIARCMAQIGESVFRERLRRKFQGDEWADDEVLVDPSRSSSTLLGQASQITRRFFEESIRYLGPLREAPHVLYDPGPTRTDLGITGEYSAAVLHAQAKRQERNPNLGSDGEWSDLSTALNYWLRQFGMATEAQAEDRGRIGIGLRVTPPYANRSLDLTSVGVGVSQVLPVMLLCLLAPPGSLVILEQPELHLHPKLQQQLADFLLACARSGRQLLVETHSEHLVNRLRRRIAEDESDETQGLVGLLFAEQHDGSTQYRASEVNALGGVDNDWPEGFLDLGAREAQFLVRSSLEKRRQRTENLPD